MEKIIHDIKSEAKIVSMLGYNLIGPDNSNCWLITDENNIQIGFIQYKKLFNKNDKKGYPATFGYHMEINGKEIKYIGTRKLDNPGFSYELDITRENGNIDHLDISVGEYPGLALWSKDYGFMSFKVDYQGLYLNFKSKTDNFNLEEVLVYKNDGNSVSDQPKEYVYQLRYCDKSLNLDSENQKGITIREICGRCTSYQQDCGQINLVENTWINNKLRTNRENLVNGKLEEMVVKHRMGIDSFNHFRFLINQILPFKQEIISSMLENYYGKREELALFISELGTINEEIVQCNCNEKEKVLIKKKDNNSKQINK